MALPSLHELIRSAMKCPSCSRTVPKDVTCCPSCGELLFNLTSMAPFRVTGPEQGGQHKTKFERRARSHKPEDSSKVDALLHEALGLPPEKRQDYLDQACGSDLALRRELTSLIEADEAAGDFLGRPYLRLSPQGGETLTLSPRNGTNGAQSDKRQSRFPPGTILAGRYQILRIIGRGGMGEVFRANDLKLGQAVALKFLPEHMEADEVRLAAFLNEVKTARQISHPNVCRVYDVGEVQGHHFISMEYIDGETLSSLLGRAGKLAYPKALELARQAAAGLAAAHQQGTLHRDLKPSNLMIDHTGRLRITDFGLAGPPSVPAARDDEAQEDTSGRNMCAGTPAYMAPEQFDGREVAFRTDVYALGLVLYEVFTGKRPFPAVALGDLIAMRRESAPLAPSRIASELEPFVERAVLDCLARDPENRPASAREVAASLSSPDAAAARWRPAPRLTLPRRPHWRMERKLGEGGFGEVWLAIHEKTREPRVFKFCYDTRRLSALKREITLFRLLKEELGERPDITRILDWNFEQAPYFIESQYTRGGSLPDWIADQGGMEEVDLSRRLEIVAQVATALSAAHSVGVLHKDVKPGNVLIMPDATDAGRAQAQLSDFGIGAITDQERLAEAGITVLGMTHMATGERALGAGTRLYMAPEVLEGKPATTQADVYGLGVMLYQLVVGDFSRALAGGWRRDVDDELLCDDIAAAVEGML